MFFSPSVSASALNRHFHTAARYGAAPSLYLNPHSLEHFGDAAAQRSSKGVQVESTDTHVTLSLDLPGLAKEQLTIAIEADVVRIESKADAPRSFKAAYQLAQDIDPASSSAKLKNGVLTLALGKLVPVSRETLLTVS